ncbi:serine hydrolase [Nostoc sp.]|uniref:serine hydrolase n=1 Tax=Nostoc sp. TaxID=1180 RepID=UPI002FF544F7
MAEKQQKNQTEQEINYLKSELERAYQIIDNLQRQNAKLQSYMTYLPKEEVQQAEIIINQGSLSSEKNHNYALIQRHQLTKLPQLQFAAIITAVASGLIFPGLLIIRWMTPQKIELPIKNPITVTNSPKSIPVAPKLSFAATEPFTPNYSSLAKVSDNLQLAYNVTTKPEFKESQELKSIVNEVVAIVKRQGLPTKPLSVTLINLKDKTISGYQQDTLRFPASVIKMFWMVVLYAQIDKGIWSSEDALKPYIYKMIGKSDNEAASYIVDLLTDTDSGTELKGLEYQDWLSKRQKLNNFFQFAGYQDINISQKVFPIPYLKLQSPAGRELQIRQDTKNFSKPIRNKVTTTHAARLLYEIYQGQAVSQKASQKMLNWLKRDLKPETWKTISQNEFNPIKTFFGESLPVNVSLFSKAGWTSASRQEAALIMTPDGKSMYILVVFGDDSKYAEDDKVFPQISHYVFEQMIAH